MRFLTLILLTAAYMNSFSQDKRDYIHYNNLMEIKGTQYILANIENRGKMTEALNKSLLFIDTRNGRSQQVVFAGNALIDHVQQIKLDSLGINKVLVTARTVDLNNKKSIDWADPQQLIVFSVDGNEKNSLTPDDFFIRTWLINNKTGVMVIVGHFDSNENGRLDKNDKNKILIYSLKTMTMLSEI